MPQTLMLRKKIDRHGAKVPEGMKGGHIFRMVEEGEEQELLDRGFTRLYWGFDSAEWFGILFLAAIVLMVVLVYVF